jgi:hypothetical protein
MDEVVEDQVAPVIGRSIPDLDERVLALGRVERLVRRLLANEESPSSHLPLPGALLRLDREEDARADEERPDEGGREREPHEGKDSRHAEDDSHRPHGLNEIEPGHERPENAPERAPGVDVSDGAARLTALVERHLRDDRPDEAERRRGQKKTEVT